MITYSASPSIKQIQYEYEQVVTELCSDLRSRFTFRSNYLGYPYHRGNYHHPQQHKCTTVQWKIPPWLHHIMNELLGITVRYIYILSSCEPESPHMRCAFRLQASSHDCSWNNKSLRVRTITWQSKSTRIKSLSTCYETLICFHVLLHMWIQWRSVLWLSYSSVDDTHTATHRKTCVT